MELKTAEFYDWEHNITGILLVLICILGLGINVYLLFQIYKRSMTIERERIPNLLLVNLAVTNIAIILFTIPLSTISSLKRSWIWGDTGCTYYGSSALIFGFAIMVTTVMLIFDILLQFRMENYDETKYRIRLYMVCFVWLNGVIWGLAPVFGWSRISYEPTRLSCTVDIMTPDSAYISYIIMTFIFCYALPILFMAYFRFRKITNPNVKTQDLRVEINRAYLILLFFLIAWTPYTIVYFWPILFEPNTIPLRLSLIGPIFAKMSVVFTPLLYVLSDKIIMLEWLKKDTINLNMNILNSNRNS